MPGDHSDRAVTLASVGVATPVGLSIEHTAAAFRAGLSALKQSAVLNRKLRPMTMALVPEEHVPAICTSVATGAPELTARQARVLRLAHLGLEDLQSRGADLEGVPLILAVPEQLPGHSKPVHDDLLEHLQEQSGMTFDLAHSHLHAYGRAGGASALYSAMKLLESGQVDRILVGGVDSYLDLRLLASLDAENRILASGVADGFAPGEGSGFVLLTTSGEPFLDSTVRIQVASPGCSRETGHRYSEEAYRGDGLAEAFRKAFEHAPPEAVRTLVSSLNGESFGAREFAVASTRNRGRIDPDCQVLHPAQCVGDLGAAFFPVALGIAAMGLLKGNSPGPILVYASSEAYQRGAVVLSS